jgi:hypothetical protein
MASAPKFYVGDKVRHKQIALTGEVVGIGKEVEYPGHGPARKIYWKGFNPFNPEQVDWTWDFCMEEW